MQKAELVATLETETSELSSRHESQRLQLRGRVEWLSDQKSEAEQLRLRHRELQAEAADCSQSVVESRSLHAATQFELTRLTEQVRDADNNLARLRAAGDQQQQIVRQPQERYSEAQQTLRRIQNHRETLLQVQDTSKSTLAENRERRSAAAARKACWKTWSCGRKGLASDRRRFSAGRKRRGMLRGTPSSAAWPICWKSTWNMRHCWKSLWDLAPNSSY